MTVLHPSTGRRVLAMIEAAQEDGDQQGHVKHLKLTIRQAGRPHIWQLHKLWLLLKLLLLVWWWCDCCVGVRVENMTGWKGEGSLIIWKDDES